MSNIEIAFHNMRNINGILLMLKTIKDRYAEQDEFLEDSAQIYHKLNYAEGLFKELLLFFDYEHTYFIQEQANKEHLEAKKRLNNRTK